MKKISFLLSVFAIVIFCSCNLSVKGKWSESDKELFRKEMKGVAELSNLGENKSKWIECYLSKCEAHYSCYNDANTDHEGGCEKLALECNKEVLSNGSIKGKWSEVDKIKFREDMNDVKELIILTDKKENWIECYLSKCEAHYSSYYEANNDADGCSKFALECNDEIK